MVETKNHITLIGIGNAAPVQLSEEVRRLVARHQVFSGGDRHHELVKDLLPKGYQWVSMKGRFNEAVHDYATAGQPIMIFASGDPYFYGIGNTLKRRVPEKPFRAYPYFNCLQLLCHRLQFDYAKVNNVSVHGRGWEALDEALITGHAAIGVLTDEDKSPATIAKRLLEYGFSGYTMAIGEELEGENEKVQQLTLSEAAKYTQAAALNCVLLSRKAPQKLAMGIPDGDFEGLPGRPGMITKQPIRLALLAALKLHQAATFWDVGSCTGSIAIEARRMYPQLKVTAFEKRTACATIILNNAKRHHAPGIQACIGDVFETNLHAFEKPEAVFIGGHGGRLAELIRLIDQHLTPGGTLAINAVTEQSAQVFPEACEALGYQQQVPLTMGINGYNTIKIMSATKPTL